MKIMAIKEPILLSLFRSGNEAGPVRPPVQQSIIRRAPSIEFATDGHLLRPRCPAAESGPGTIRHDIAPIGTAPGLIGGCVGI